MGKYLFATICPWAVLGIVGMPLAVFAQPPSGNYAGAIPAGPDLFGQRIENSDPGQLPAFRGERDMLFHRDEPAKWFKTTSQPGDDRDARTPASGTVAPSNHEPLRLLEEPKKIKGGADDHGILLAGLLGMIAVAGLLMATSKQASAMASFCALMMSVPFSLWATFWLLMVLVNESQHQTDRSYGTGPPVGYVLLAIFAIASTIGLAIGFVVALRRDA